MIQHVEQPNFHILPEDSAKDVTTCDSQAATNRLGKWQLGIHLLRDFEAVKCYSHVPMRIGSEGKGEST